MCVLIQLRKPRDQTYLLVSSRAEVGLISCHMPLDMGLTLLQVHSHPRSVIVNLKNPFV